MPTCPPKLLANELQHPVRFRSNPQQARLLTRVKTSDDPVEVTAGHKCTFVPEVPVMKKMYACFEIPVLLTGSTKYICEPHAGPRQLSMDQLRENKRIGKFRRQVATTKRDQCQEHANKRQCQNMQWSVFKNIQHRNVLKGQ